VRNPHPYRRVFRNLAIGFAVKAVLFFIIRDALQRAVKEEMRNGRYAYMLENEK